MWKFWKNNRKEYPSTSPEWLKTYFDMTAGIDLKAPSSEVPFVVIDLESTGLDTSKDRIISFGLIPLLHFDILPGQSFECFVRQSYFDRETIPIHGILPGDIEDGLTEIEFLETIIPLLAGKVIVGHHVGFDMAMINQTLHRHFQVKLLNHCVDTGALYKKIFPGKFAYNKYQNPILSLDEIASEFDIISQDRHSALGDALTTAFIFLKLWKHSEKRKRSKLKELVAIRAY